MTYDDLKAGQTANPPVYDQQGMQTATASSGGAYKPLPQLNTSGQPTYSAGATTDPISSFNMQLFQMLQRAQGGNQNAPLMGERNTLQNAQLNASTAPGSPGAGGAPLRPGDALNARQDEGNTYSPEIKNITDRMTLNNQAIASFKDALDSAKSFGDDYAKYIKPDDATIKAVTEQMEAGYVPDAAVLEKVGKYLPNDIWAKAAAAKEAQSGSNHQVVEVNGRKLLIDQSTGKTVKDLGAATSSSGPSTSFKFASGDRGQLLAVGFNDADVNKIQNDIGVYGIDKVTEGMSDAQKNAVKAVVGGATYSQQQKSGNQFLTSDFFKQQYGAGLQAAAQTAGFTKQSGGLFNTGAGANTYGDTDAYLTNLMQRVDTYRKAGYSDQDILKLMQ